jgi:hypothetical protein
VKSIGITDIPHKCYEIWQSADALLAALAVWQAQSHRHHGINTEPAVTGTAAAQGALAQPFRLSTGLEFSFIYGLLTTRCSTLQAGKFAGSILDQVIELTDLILPAALDPGVDSATNIGAFLGVKGGRRVKLTTANATRLSTKCGDPRRLRTPRTFTAYYDRFLIYKDPSIISGTVATVCSIPIFGPSGHRHPRNSPHRPQFTPQKHFFLMFPVRG